MTKQPKDKKVKTPKEVEEEQLKLIALEQMEYAIGVFFKTTFYR